MLEHGDVGELSRDDTCDLRRLSAGVKRHRVEPHLAQALSDGLIAQLLQANLVRPCIGKRRVRRARPREVAIELNHCPDVDDHKEGGRPSSADNERAYDSAWPRARIRASSNPLVAVWRSFLASRTNDPRRYQTGLLQRDCGTLARFKTTAPYFGTSGLR